MKSCNTCGLDIPLGASYCTHCDTFQSWRRHLQFGQVTLPMLVALVAVLGTSIPAVSHWFTVHNSRLASSALRSSSNNIELTVANLGDRPGVADEVVFQLAWLEDPENFLLSWVGPHSIRFISADSPVVPPGDVKKFKFVLADGQDEATHTPTVQAYYGGILNKASCSMIFTGTEFQGETHSFAREVPCYQTWTSIFPDSRQEFAEPIEDLFDRWRRTEGSDPAIESILPDLLRPLTPSSP